MALPGPSYLHLQFCTLAGTETVITHFHIIKMLGVGARTLEHGDEHFQPDKEGLSRNDFGLDGGALCACRGIRRCRLCRNAKESVDPRRTTAFDSSCEVRIFSESIFGHH